MLRDSILCTILDEVCGKSTSSSVQARSHEARLVRDDLTLLVLTGKDIVTFIEDIRIYNGAPGDRFEKIFKIVAES